MQATIHAVLLITLPVVAVVLVLSLKRRIPALRQLLIALFLASLGTWVAPACNHHLCHEGEPRNQWLILGPVLALVLVFVNSQAWRRLLAACVFVAMMGLSCHFTHLVHEPGWTGNPAWDGGQQLVLRSFERTAEVAASESGQLDVSLQEGWLRDSSIWSALRGAIEDRNPYRRQIQAVWHTPLTGLHPYTSIAQDFWCPGGTLKDAISRVELRDRPAQQ